MTASRNSIEKIDKEFEQLFVEVGTAFGSPQITPKIIFNLMKNDEISMKELHDRIGYSLASISMKIKTLESIGLVHKFTKPGSKKIYLRMEKDMSNVLRKAISAKYELQIKPLRRELPKLLEKYKSLPKNKEAKKRICMIKTLQNRITAFDRIVKLLTKGGFL